MTSVAIVATGARTPLGLSSSAAAAAYRAGINRLGKHPFLIDRLGNPMSAAVDPKLPPSTVGPSRLVPLVYTAIAEACRAVGLADLRRVPLHLALPEVRPGFTLEQGRAVVSGLRSCGDPALALGDVTTYLAGHAAGASAIHDAMALLRSGATELCLVAGVDSYFDPNTVEWLDEHRQIAGDDGRSSFVPGEGAGCLLMASEAGLARLGSIAIARISAVGVGAETSLIKSSNLCLGEGLTATVARCAASLDARWRVNEVICDINGERYRGEEWGFVCLRLPSLFDDPTGYHSPADSWGDMGAASIPLFGMLACEAALRGSARGPRTMIWASSERGLRGAVLLEAEVAR